MATEKELAIIRSIQTIVSPPDGNAGFDAFIQLCAIDLKVAEHMAEVMAAAFAGTERITKPILEGMREGADQQSGPPLDTDDDKDTAAGLAAHMGWEKELC